VERVAPERPSGSGEVGSPDPAVPDPAGVLDAPERESEAAEDRLGPRSAELERLRVILEGVADGITVQDGAGRLVYANDSAARMMGFGSPAEVLATPASEIMTRFELLDELGNPMSPASLPGRRALLGEPADGVVGYRIRETGEELWSYVKATPVRGPDGRVEAAINIFHDITARRRAEESVRFLAEASEVLAESLDYERTLGQVAKLAVPRLADWCVVYIVQPDGAIARIAIEHAGGQHETLAELLGPYPLRPDADSGVPRVLRSGEPLLVPDLTPRLLTGDLDAPEDVLESLESLGLVSWMCVPLAARGRNHGAISLISGESGRRFSEQDLRLAQDLARRAALAVDNARLFDETQSLLTAERKARAQAEEAAETLRSLQSVTETGLAHLPLEERLSDLLERIRDLLNVDTAAVLLLDDEGNKLVATVAKGLEDEVELGVRIPVGRGFAGRVAAERRAIVIEDVASADILNPLIAKKGIHSLLGVPLLVEDRLIGVLHVGSLEQRRFTQEDAVLLQLVGDRIALALEQSRLYEAERTARAEAEQAEHRIRFLAEASTILAESLDYEETLRSVARLAIPELADWCFVDMIEQDGSLRRVALEHLDPQKVRLAWEMFERHPPPREHGAYIVAHTGQPRVAEITPETLDAAGIDPELRRRIEELGFRHYLAAPITGREGVVGVITLLADRPERVYGGAEVELAQEIARRAAIAIENAVLFRSAEQRARAAQALQFVGDAVVLLDPDAIVRLWNPAAAAMTGLPEVDVVGRPIEEALPGWAALAPRVPVGSAEGPASTRPEALPVEIEVDEHWLSISGVRFAEGTVYAFRDITREIALEKMKSDFVSTVSHELRTPLAAIYGAALTLRREDILLDGGQRDDLLGVIAAESDRLARIVNDILWTSRIESENVQIAIERCDATELARSVASATKLHLPPGIDLDVELAEGLPSIVADPDKVRQVLANLLENAIKYSPDGGRVRLRLESGAGVVRFLVHDEGIGIPADEHERIFEKFYRLDPGLTRGVGGTGLGLYICRELVRLMDGRIAVRSSPNEGSTFALELPIAEPAALAAS
jgi:PAS domain S-box-containing protein